MTPFVYLNGELVPQEDAKIPLNDRGALYGDGLVATVRVENGEPYLLQAHIDRLREQCEALSIRTPIPTESALRELIAVGPTHPVQRLRIVVTGGTSFPFDLRPRTGSSYAFLEPYDYPTPTSLRMGLSQTPLTLAHARYKTMANFNRFWVSHEAKARGFDDGISVTPDQYILEASFGNLFWIHDNQLYYPDPSLPYYLGITLTNLLEKVSFRLHEVMWTLKDLPVGSYCYRTNTMGGVVPISQIETYLFPTCPWSEHGTLVSL